MPINETLTPLFGVLWRAFEWLKMKILLVLVAAFVAVAYASGVKLHFPYPTSFQENTESRVRNHLLHIIIKDQIMPHF